MNDLNIWVINRQGRIERVFSAEEALSKGGDDLYALVRDGSVCPGLEADGDIRYGKNNLGEVLKALEALADQGRAGAYSVHPVTKRLGKAIVSSCPEFPRSLPCHINEDGLADLDIAKKNEEDARLEDLNGAGYVPACKKPPVSSKRTRFDYILVRAFIIACLAAALFIAAKSLLNYFFLKW